MKNYTSTGCYNPWWFGLFFDYNWMEWVPTAVLRSDLWMIPPGDLREYAD